MSAVIYEKTAGLAILRLNRPEKFNSINKQMADACLHSLADSAEDDNVRALVLTGEGESFCAGQDLKEVLTIDTQDGVRSLLEDRYSPLVQSIVSLPKPVICAVNGVAAGAGANLALCCDIVVACKGAKFIQAFSTIGLIPDSGGTYFLPRLIGRARAMAYAMIGEEVSASRAEAVGMIYRCYPDEEFEKKWMALAENLSAAPTHALALTKMAINQSFDNTLAAQLEIETDFQLRAASSEDYKEGLAAFIEKRKPNFKGQ